ncbi:T7SS_mycosin, type VII secretion-associated serine protease mycosin [Candidatus Nanopelagicaceae bacterium]
MKKFISLFVVIALAAAGTTPAAQAATPKTLVIIDSGIAADLPWVQQMLVDEACFIEYGKCPNGQSTMFGKGAAALQVSRIKDKAMSHGTQMASVAYEIDPSTKLVMIRIVGMSDKGFANSYTTRAVTKALNWVTENAERLNVGAVSLSVGRAYKEASCPIETELQTQVRILLTRNIPVIAATGNGSNKLKVDYPACVPEVIAVGATDRRYTVKAIQGWVYPIMLISNQGPDLDLYALGRYTTTDAFGQKSVSMGTSSATAAFATYVVKQINLGLGYTDVMTKVRASLVNAYRTVTDYVPLHFEIVK